MEGSMTTEELTEGDICLIRMDRWGDWWKEASGAWQSYVALVLVALSTVLTDPITRIIFFILRKGSPRSWRWPDDAKRLGRWQTALLFRTGMLWISLKASNLDKILCQWPSWGFGICLVVWLDAVFNVLRAYIIRRETEKIEHEEAEEERPKMSDADKAGRITLLEEGSTMAKIIFLVLVVYTYYLDTLIGEDERLRFVFSSAFFLCISVATLPILRNVMGGHYMFLSNMLHIDTRIQLPGTSQGSISDAPLGFLVVTTDDDSKLYIPAGQTVSLATTVIQSYFWRLQLRIRLPAHASTSQVRAFMQDLDRILQLEAAFAHKKPEKNPLTRNPSSVAASEKSKDLLHLNLREEDSLIERARGNESLIALEPMTKWVVHFHISHRASHKRGFRTLRTSYIETITKLLEDRGLSASTLVDTSLPPITE